ncbi:hypothetical protein [Streptomyces avidinii]
MAGMLIPAVLAVGFAAPAGAEETEPKISVNVSPGQSISGIFEVELKVPAGLVRTEGAVATTSFGGTPHTPLPLEECARGCTVRIRQDTTWTRPLPAGDGITSQNADGPGTFRAAVSVPRVDHHGSVQWGTVAEIAVPVVLANKWPAVTAATPLVAFQGTPYAQGLLADKEFSFKISAPQPLAGVFGAIGTGGPHDVKPVTFTADPSNPSDPAGTSWTAKVDTSAYKSGTWLQLQFAGTDAKGGHSSARPPVMVAVDHGMKLVAKPDVQRTADWTGLSLSFTTGVDPVRIDAELDGRPWHSGTVSEQWLKDHAREVVDGNPSPWGLLRATGDNLGARPLPVGKHTLKFTVVDKLGVSSSLSVPVDIPVPGGPTATPGSGSGDGGSGSGPTAAAGSGTAAGATATPNAPGALGGGALARTGSSGVVPVVAGAAGAALVLGAAALLAARRRAGKA